MSVSPFSDPAAILVVALEGWNDAGDAASDAARMIVDHYQLGVLSSIDPEEFFDFQLTRPMVVHENDGTRSLTWPDVTLYGPSDKEASAPLVLLGQEPSRLWKSFASRMIDHALAYGVEHIVFLGSMLADVPHSRPVTVSATSDDPEIRRLLDVEKSSYEGPVGVLTVLSLQAATEGIASLHLWAHIPHYVHTAPSPKATLALLDRLEELTGLSITRDDLEVEALRWEEGIDALAEEDEEMTAYIDQLERQRDAVDAPEATGDAIAQEFEKYLRGRKERPGSSES